MSRERYVVSPFLREMYRAAMAARRKRDGDEEGVPSTLDSIVLVREDYLSHLGRFVLLIQEGSYREARAFTIDRMNGTYEVQSIDAAHPHSESGACPRPLKELIYNPIRTIEFCRMMELLDHGDPYYHDSQGFLLIAGALERPEGLGYPEFTKGFAQHLLAKERAASVHGRSGNPDGLRQDAWYAHVRKEVDMRMYNHEPPKLEWTIGQADLRFCGGDWNCPPRWREDESFFIRFDNEGYGAAWPSNKFLCGEPWVGEQDKFFELSEDDITELRKHILPSFTDTSQVLRDELYPMPG